MLRSVEIQNFRSCLNTSFGLDTTLSALCGRNGVGKTNVLQAIEWACSTAVKVDRARLIDVVPNLTSPGGTSLEMEIELDGGRYRYRFLGPSVLASGLRADIVTESLEVRSNGAAKTIFQRTQRGLEVIGRSETIRIPRLTPGFAVLSSLLPDDDPAALHIEKVGRFLKGVRYYSLDDSATEHLVTEQEYADWKLRYQVEGDLTSSLSMRLLYMQEEDPELFNELRGLLGADGLDLVENIRVVTLETPDLGMDVPTPKVKRFMPVFRPSRRMGGAGGEYGNRRLSTGTLRAIQIVTSMLFDRRSLMLMEQPEDSIHPGLLEKLIDLLRTYSSDTQVLFTTHSPAVLDMLRPEEVLLATAEEGATQVRRLTSEEMERAKDFLATEGVLSEFLEAQDDL